LRKGIVFLFITMMLVLVACQKSVPEDKMATDGPGKQKAPENTAAAPEIKTGQLEVKEEPKVEVKDVPKPSESSPKEEAKSIPEVDIYYTEKTVVLTYHHISSKPVSSITIKPERFEEDLKMLKDNNFNVITLKDMMKGVQGEANMPQNAVAITFDDGYESFYKYAYPILKKYNMPSTLFVITSWTESYSASAGDIGSIGPHEIVEMQKSGLVDIESHSHSGHDYTVRDEKGNLGGVLAFKTYDKNTGKYETQDVYEKRVVEDLAKSIPIIEKYTGVRPDTFCFPFGHYNTRLVELGKMAGFKYFVTTAYGYNRENSKNVTVRRIRSGDAKLSAGELKTNIINCGQEKPVN